MAQSSASSIASSVGTHEQELGRHRTALNVRGLSLLFMAFQTLGIIYSDLGTSPLYVLNGIWRPSRGAPSKEDVIGGVSAIVWSLTLLPLIKYAFIALHFGTHEGEGGTFALFQGLYPPKAFETAPTRDSLAASQPGQPKNSNHKAPKNMKWILLVWSLFGTSLTIADGVLTAAVSVTSAVGGIAVAKPEVSKDVTPIAIAFLVVLFMAQPFGTARLASVFAPITCCWFLFLAATGIYNITTFPEIWRAYDPSRVVLYFVRTKDYDTLSGVLLAVTGCEALFANLGQFNMLSIQLSFGSFVYPTLILAYLGQGARLIDDGPNVIQNVFYLTIPGKANGPLFWILYVLAILATLIASQAMITAAFSLVQQLVNMKTLPPFRLVYTSDKVQGQIYVPVVNWTFMVVTIIIVAAFKNSAYLTNAYGFCVSTVMFASTVLIALQTRYVKQLPIAVGLAFFIPFGFFDGLFWGASLKKVPYGAWVPLMIGLILLTLMVFWNWAKGLEEQFDITSRRRLERFIVLSGNDEHLSGAGGDGSINEVISEREAPVYCIVPPLNVKNESEKMVHAERQELGHLPLLTVFHKMADERGVPHSFTGFIHQWPALPRFAVFLTAHVLPVGHVTLDRYVIDKMDSLPGVYASIEISFPRVTVQIDEIIQRIYALELCINPDGAQEVIRQLSAVASRYTHILPYYDFVSRPVRNGFLAPIRNKIRTFLIEDIYRRLCVIFPETVNWLAKPDEIIYVGISAKI